MIALAQVTAGLALVMGFALLCIRQMRAASILSAVQSIAVATSALVSHQPIMAIPPLLFAAGAWAWFAPGHFAPGHPAFGHSGTLESRTAPLGGAKLGIGAGAILAVLCQSQGGFALSLAVVLLSILLAATRRHPLMHVVALVGIQNGVVLAASLVAEAGVPPALLLAVAGLLVPLPLALGLAGPTLIRRSAQAPAWSGWVDLALALAVFVATLLVPLDSLASVFAPLLGLDGILRSCRRRKRLAMSPINRGVALLAGALPVLTVCPPSPIIAWLAILASITISLLPALLPAPGRRWDHAVLGFIGTGIALFGLCILTLVSSVLGYFAVFVGFAAIAAVVPDLAVVLVILVLRLANRAPWPSGAEALGIAIALIALLVCAIMPRAKSSRSAVTLLQQSQASIAALSVCLGQADGRFAALVLIILLILTRAAARVTDGPVASLAVAGLGGVPPLGVFPGLVLVVLAMTNRNGWLLFPVGAAIVQGMIASLPKRLDVFSPKVAIPSVGWLPLALALLAGYFAPDGLVRWWHVLTAGRG